MTTSLKGPKPQTSDKELVANLCQKRVEIQTEIAKRIVGQTDVIEHLLIALFARGHGLFVGVPGLAKTLLINTLAEVLDLKFNRVQFTPDLMPSDIVGSDILEEDATGKRHFRFVYGPVFCNLLLADEINRTPPKTQAALLQSMQEYRVTASGTSYPLEMPFHVFATQNPIEHEGTYPLPEAQLDRFMMMLTMDYPSMQEECEVIERTTASVLPTLNKILSPEEMLNFQALVLRVPVARPVVEYAVGLVQRTRPHALEANKSIKEYVSFGAGPRATQHLVLAAKARAVLNGRPTVDKSDIDVLFKPVLRHRVLTNFHAEAKRIHVDALLEEVLASFS